LLLFLLQVGVFVTPWPAVPAMLLVGLGVAIVIGGMRGMWHGVLVTFAVLLTLFTAVSVTATTTLDIPIAGTGDRTYTPQDVTELEPRYELGAGTIQVDLREMTFPEGTTPVAVDIGVGEARLRVPEGIAVRVSADSGTGEVELFGETHGGLGVDRAYVSPGYEEAGRRLEIDVHVGMGRIEVTR
jgi:hypothetical protein